MPASKDKKHTRDNSTSITKDMSDITLQENGLEAEIVLSSVSNGDTFKPKKHKKKKHKTSKTCTDLCDKTPEICESKETMKEKFDFEKYSVASSMLDSDSVRPKKQKKKKQNPSDISCEETEPVGDRKGKTKKLEGEKYNNSIEQAVPEVKPCLFDSDTSKPKKHKKKKHKTSKTCTDVCDKTPEICESKETMKEKFDFEKYSVASSMLDSDSVRPKKQKKKKQNPSGIACEETEPVGDRKGKTKKLEGEKCNNSIEQAVPEVKPCLFDSDTSKPKKHKKKKHKTANADSSDASPVNSEEKRDKKPLNSEPGNNHETTVNMPKQRKRKKHKHQDAHNNMKSKYCKKDEHNEEDTNEINQNLNEVSTENSKQGKKRKKHSKDQDESFEHSITPDSEPKSKKVKKSKKKCKDSDVDTNLEVLVSQKLLDESTESKRERKKIEKNKDAVDDFSLMASPVENVIQKEKSKQRSNNFLNELCEISSVKPAMGEQDEKIHCSTQSSASNNNNTCTSTIQGQWQGCMFENADRQAKFLRLLGGMKKPNPDEDKDGGPKKGLFSSQNSLRKKGLFGSLTSMTSDGNTALSVSDATSLDQKLEEEYNKAMNFRLSGKKGAGFGFIPDPAEGKKFHIDVNKSKSIKFDD